MRGALVILKSGSDKVCKLVSQTVPCEVHETSLSDRTTQGLLTGLLEWPPQNSNTCLKAFHEFSIVCAARAGAGHCALVGVTHQSYTWALSSGSGVATRTKPPHQDTWYLISWHDKHTQRTHRTRKIMRRTLRLPPRGTSKETQKSLRRRSTVTSPRNQQNPLTIQNNAQNPSGASSRNSHGDAEITRRILRVPPLGTRKETQKQCAELPGRLLEEPVRRRNRA
jgi:hypothetical protein